MIDRLLAWLGLGPFGQLAAHDRVLAVISVAVLVLFLVTLAFALVVLVLRTGHVRSQRRREDLDARWTAPLLDVLGGDDPAVLQSRVNRGEELELLSFLLRYARRVRGDERRLLASIAEPYLPHAEREARSRNPERRAHAIQTLAAFGMPGCTAIVLRALDDRSPFVAMIAAQALARPEHAEHAPEVVRRLWRFTEWSGAYLAAMLSRVGPAVAAASRAMLGNDGAAPQARAVSAEVLARLSDPPAAEVAASVLRRAGPDAPLPYVPLHAASLELLAQVGHADHLATARPFMRSPHALVRAAAMRVVAVLGSTADADELIAGLRDGSPWVAREAARGLLRLGRGDVLRALAAESTASGLFARMVLAEGERA